MKQKFHQYLLCLLNSSIKGTIWNEKYFLAAFLNYLLHCLLGKCWIFLWLKMHFHFNIIQLNSMNSASKIVTHPPIWLFLLFIHITYTYLRQKCVKRSVVVLKATQLYSALIQQCNVVTMILCIVKHSVAINLVASDNIAQCFALHTFILFINKFYIKKNQQKFHQFLCVLILQ
jgi:hypothetical protein